MLLLTTVLTTQLDPPRRRMCPHACMSSRVRLGSLPMHLTEHKLLVYCATLRAGPQMHSKPGRAARRSPPGSSSAARFLITAAF